MFKDKEAEEKLEKYETQISNLKKKLKHTQKKNEKLENEKRKVLEEKKNILEKQDNELKGLIKKISENEQVDISGDTREMINRLESEIFNLKEEVDELNNENNELIEELDDYKRKGKYAIQTEDKITLPDESKINGSIKSEGGLELLNSVIVYGSIEAVSDIVIGDDVTIEGSVISDTGSVTIGSKSEIDGIIKGTRIEMADNSKSGNIQSSGDVILNQSVEVSNVTAVGDVKLNKGVKIQGKLEYAGDLNGAKGVTITESVFPLSREEVEEDLKDEEKLTMEDTEWIEESVDEEDVDEDIEEEVKEDPEETSEDEL